jgi:hypothetical protein
VLRIVLALTLFFLSIYACEGGYESCKAKVRDSHAIKNDALFIPLTDAKELVYSKDIPNATILKSNPFLSLYLIKSKKTFKYPFTLNTHLALGNAAVNERFAIEGKITSPQIGLNKFAHFNEPPFVPSLLLNSCCNLEGIITPKGIIQKEYLLHFINAKDTRYSDIGIRVEETKQGIRVRYVDPFLQDNPFHVDDIILLFDDKKVANSAALMQKILFASVDALHRVRIRREGEIMNLSITSGQRYGGGFLSDTFLEQKGLFFNERLEIVSLDTTKVKNGLHRGDQLLQVNGIRVHNQEDVLSALSKASKEKNFLFQRDSFQFFVQIN